MITLSYGYKKPEDGDRGSTLFTALEDNIQRLNDHTHNGTNSAPLTAASLQGVPATALAVNWVAFGPTGHYRQLLTLPAGFNFDTVHISVRCADDYVYPTIERVSATTFYIYTIDNTLPFTVVYGG